MHVVEEPLKRSSKKKRDRKRRKQKGRRKEPRSVRKEKQMKMVKNKKKWMPTQNTCNARRATASTTEPRCARNKALEWDEAVARMLGTQYAVTRTSWKAWGKSVLPQDDNRRKSKSIKGSGGKDEEADRTPQK